MCAVKTAATEMVDGNVWKTTGSLKFILDFEQFCMPGVSIFPWVVQRAASSTEVKMSALAIEIVY